MKLKFWILSLVCCSSIVALSASEISTLKGTEKGALKEWSEGENVDLYDKDGTQIKSIMKEDFVMWSAKAAINSRKGRVFVRLTNGVGLNDFVKEWTEEGFKLNLAYAINGNREMEVSYDDICTLIFLDRVPGTKREKLLQEVKKQVAENDAKDEDDREDFLFLENDFLSGLLESIDGSIVEFNRNDKTKSFKMSEVLATALANDKKEVNEELLLKTVDGYEFPVKSFSEKEGVYIFKTQFGDVKIAKSKISSIKYQPKNRLFLGDITPSKVEEGLPGEKMENYPFGYKINRSVKFGQPLATKKREWTQGIGVHSDSKLTWKLPENAKSLSGAVAIDNEAWGGGSVHFRVYADGKKLFDSGLMTGQKEAQYFNVSLKDKKQVVLECVTDPGKEEKDFTRDRADWLDLILTLEK